MYFELLKRFENGRSIPILDPVKEMDIDSKTLSKLANTRKTILEELSEGDIKELNPA